jgi:hypothetical protein
MAVTQKGMGVAWGITTSGYTYTGAATTLNVKSLEQSLTRDAEMVEVKDANGEAAGLVFFNPTSELTLRVYPFNATTLSGAATAAAALPAVGDKFVITDASDASIAGDYVVMRVGKTRSSGAQVEFDLTVKKWATDLSATIT